MSKEQHFWSSHQYKDFMGGELKYQNYAILDGVEVPFDCCSDTLDTGFSWEDKVYLGKGTYSRCEVI